MIGYKVVTGNYQDRYKKHTFNSDENYLCAEEITFANNGFHFCTNLSDTMTYYYDMRRDNPKILKVEVSNYKLVPKNGDFIGERGTAQELKIIEEVNYSNVLQEEYINWKNIAKFCKLTADQEKMYDIYLKDYPQFLSESWLNPIKNEYVNAKRLNCHFKIIELI